MDNERNNDFMFSQSRENDPYADNAAFLAKVFTVGKLLFLVLLFALSVAAMICAAVNAKPVNAKAAGNDTLNTLCTSFYALAACNGIYLAGAVIAAGGSLARKRISSASPAFFIVGSAASAAVCIWYVVSGFNSAQKLKESLRILADAPDYSGYAVFLPYVLMALLSAAGIVFFTSMIRTIRGKGLFGNGAGIYRLLLNINAALGIITGVYTSYATDWLVFPAVLFIPPAAVMMFGSFLVGRYLKGLEAANRAISMGGVNLYMNESGASAQYYQSTYSSPDTSCPPVSADKNNK